MRTDTENPTNGAGAAAILAAGIGCFSLGVLAVAGDGSRSVVHLLTLYPPTGPLSGVSSIAIAIWLITWMLLSRRWRAKTVALMKVNLAAFVLLGIGFLLTFPPFADLLLRK